VKILSCFEIVVVSVLLIFLPLVDSKQLMNSIQSEKSFFFFAVLAIILILRVFKNTFQKKSFYIRITWPDFFLAVYAVYIVFNRFLVAKNAGNSLHFFETIGLAIIYILFRATGNKTNIFFLYVLMIAGTVQAVYGTLQLYGIYHSHHNLFKSTGGFFNPGPYAGYLASVFPVALSFYLFYGRLNGESQLVKWIQNLYFFTINKLKIREFNNKKINLSFIPSYFALLPVVTILIILPALRSRASWLAVLAALGYIFYNKYYIREILATRLYTNAKKTGAILLSFILLTGLILGLYHFKKDSADGRALIWQVTAKMIREKPLTGMGYEKFTAKYMNYQAEYFEKNPGSNFDMVADDNMYAFNEYLKIASETGFTGLILALLVIVLVFVVRTDINSQQKKVIIASRAGILSVLVFALFSYPAEILPIKLNFVFLLAVLAGYTKTIKIYTLARFFRFVAAMGILVILIFSVPFFKKWHQSYKVWNDANMAYNWELYEDCLEDFERAYPMLKHNGMFLVNYGKALSMAGKNREAIDMLTYAQDYLTNTIVFTAMGDSYKALDEYKEAEKAYTHALNMIPGRFYPKYLLAKLYDESGQTEKVLTMAREILEMEVKIESTAVEEIKTEMEKMINKIKK